MRQSWCEGPAWTLKGATSPNRSLSRGRCGLRRLAENAAASLAQMRSLPAHAGGDPLDIGYFRRAEPPDVRRAKPPLILLRECPAGRRPQSPRCHDASRKQQPPNAKHLTHRPLQIDRRCGRHPRGSPPWNRCMIVIWILSVSTRGDRRALLLLSWAAPVPGQEPLRSRAATKPASGTRRCPRCRR